MWEVVAEFVGWILHLVAAACAGVLAFFIRWVRKIERDLEDHRICVAENYVRREDYVQQTSLILAKLDANATLLARLDERSKRWEEH